MAAAAVVAVSSASEAALVPLEADLVWEEELLREPYSLALWLRYLEARKAAPPQRRHLLYERALRALPGSYKLWHAYLSERWVEVRGLSPAAPARAALANTFERALVYMHKMPVVWEMFLRALVAQRLVTRTRRACDRALAALPVTQHDRVWAIYLDFVRQDGVPVDTALRVYRRYLKLEPGHAEEYIAFLKSRGHWNEAAERLADVVNDDTFLSLAGKSKHTLWLELCDLITKHPAEVKGLPVDAILRGGIRKFTDEVGRLWTSLADFYIRRGLFEKARDVYEEGIGTVVTVRDFSMIYDAYTQFEESMLSAKMEQLAELGDAAGEDEEADAGDGGEGFLLRDNGDDIDLRLARLDFLTDRRPELLSSVMLRQNPHSVPEWRKRVGLFEGDPTKQILTFTEAVKTVDPQKAVGKPHMLWVDFAKFYEGHGDVANARVIFEKATEQRFKAVEDLATVYCEWAEMELRAKQFKQALALLARATQVPPKPPARGDTNAPVQDRVHRSVRLWTMYCDLEESLGTLDSARAAYDRMLDLRVATPQVVLNYAAMLQEHKYFEDAFRVYERGVAAFRYPHAKEIWAAYLSAFVERYGGRKLERARDLYEQAIKAAPVDCVAPLYTQYAKLEEEHGLGRRAMDIYRRAVHAVPDKEKLTILDLYAARGTEFFGAVKVRGIYEDVIDTEGVADDVVRGVVLRFVKLERSLGEVDRARALFVYGSQVANPAVEQEYWESWKEFEVKHGNEDTFKEMLRIKRSVAASFSDLHFNMATVEVPASALGGGKRARGMDAMAALEAQADAEGAARQAEAQQARRGTAVPGFVSAGITGGTVGAATGGAGAGAGVVTGGDAGEIDLGDDSDEDGDGEGGDAGGLDVSIAQKEVPAAVFGSVGEAARAGEAPAPLGAKERIKRQRVE